MIALVLGALLWPDISNVYVTEGLDPLLYPIAVLESSNGAHVRHAPNPQGEWYTALGPLGLKPSTAKDRYDRTPSLHKRYPGLQENTTFLARLQSDPVFYNRVASAHFQHLMRTHGSPAEAARAWRYGSTAVLTQQPTALNDVENYVGRYVALLVSGK